MQEQWVCVYGCGAYAFFSASLGVWGVCSCVVRVTVLTGSYGKYVIECSLRDEYSGRVEFMGKGITRHVPVKWGVRRPPPFSVYGM